MSAANYFKPRLTSEELQLPKAEQKALLASRKARRQAAIEEIRVRTKFVKALEKGGYSHEEARDLYYRMAR